jgi:hypothetical protein
VARTSSTPPTRDPFSADVEPTRQDLVRSREGRFDSQDAVRAARDVVGCREQHDKILGEKFKENQEDTGEIRTSVLRVFDTQQVPLPLVAPPLILLAVVVPTFP